MGSVDDAAYAELLQAIQSAQDLIEQLEATEPTPKRDRALQILRGQHTAAIRRLEEIDSGGHRN